MTWTLFSKQRIGEKHVQPPPISAVVIPAEASSAKPHHVFPLVMLVLMGAAVLLVDATLPLRGLWFYDVLPRTPVASWLLLPSHLLFPGLPTAFFQPGMRTSQAGPLSLAWKETGILFASLVLLFSLYLLAIHRLAGRVSLRFILCSTLVLGILFTLIPVVTSQDIFSYIGYMHLGVFFHLNPLTALPIALHNDPLQARIYWLHQPSAYGPTWFLLTGALQELTLLAGLKQVEVMVLLLRWFSLGAHLGSTVLIWSISQRLPLPTDGASTLSPSRRLGAILAFAWNPFLLLEAGVNAHNDITILFLVLLALWFLVRFPGTLRGFALAAALLAAAAGIKITLSLLLPGLLLFLWRKPSRRGRSLLVTLGAYLGTILVLYAPFWQHGQVLHFLLINPGSAHEQNSLYEFLLRLYAGFRGSYIAPATQLSGSHLENLVHLISITSLMLAYGGLVVWALLPSQGLKNIADLLRWMAMAWLVYLLVGSPWFWPWYAITLFGLCALLEASSARFQRVLGVLDLPRAERMATFSLLTLYCWLSLAPVKTLIPHLHLFQVAYLRGLWIWLPPLLAVCAWPLWNQLQTQRNERKALCKENPR